VIRNVFATIIGNNIDEKRKAKNIELRCTRYSAEGKKKRLADFAGGKRKAAGEIRHRAREKRRESWMKLRDENVSHKKGTKMKRSLKIGLFLLCMTTAPVAAQEKVVIGGSGSLTDEMADLAKAYMAKNPSDSIQVQMDSMSSTGGMEGAKMGRLTIGLVTDEPQGADKGKLVYKAIGRTPTAVAVNKANQVGNLSEAQVCDIFSGKIKTWKDVGGSDSKIMILTRKKDDSNTESIREKMMCFKTLHIAADAISLVRGSEVLDALDKRTNTVGIVNVGTSLTERPNAKAISIDGVSPSTENVQSGKYKFFNERGVVTLGAPHGASKRFLEFVASAEGQKILVRRGVVPSK
jgi:phosphate transport system substrate-binding protein